jgi:5-methylcytosine-specific restriction endonuclease McrA
MNRPPYLPDCDPETRVFPWEWKWALYRFSRGTSEGFQCPICKRTFSGPERGGFAELHGDHIIPWTMGGRTTWDNLQLLCGSCNLRKSSSVESPTSNWQDKLSSLTMNDSVPLVG